MVDSQQPESSEPAIVYSPTDVLAAIQRVEKNEDVRRQQLIADLDGLVRLLVKNNGRAEGITYGALGGIQYAIGQLQASYDCHSLEELERRYAQDELQSYPQSQAEVQETCAAFYQPGMEIMIDKVNLPVGTRFRIYLKQAFHRGRQYLAAGTLITSSNRQHPPLSKIHHYL